jgi:hypothetical protein
VSRYRKVHLCMYADERYRRLTPSRPCGQSLWWHLIAGEQTDIIPGLFKIGEAAFAEQLNWSLKGFRESFAECFREGLVKADWEARLVWIPNSLKYNPPHNPNVVKSWHYAWLELPECALKVEATQALKAFLKGLGKGFEESFGESVEQSGTGTGTGINTPLPPKGGKEKNHQSHKPRRRRVHETADELLKKHGTKTHEENAYDRS